jgi:hypothetical protein
MRKIAKAAVKFFIISAVMKLVGTVVSRAYEGERTASDDDFKLMALMDGRQLVSEATSLRTGTAFAAMGGIDLDLTAATLDPGGAHIALRAYMGGIRLVVPKEWKVYLEEDSGIGGIDVRTPDPATLGEDAPRLTIEAITRPGGILIEATD